MARGTSQQQQTVNSAASTDLSNAQNLYGTVSSADNAILKNPGYSPAQINTQMNAALTPIAGQTAAAQTSLKQRAAATGNSAGLVAGQDQAARTGAQLGSQAAYGVQSNADNVALQQQNQALNNLTNLYGTTTGAATNLYGQGTSLAENTPSVLQDVQSGANIFRTILPAPKS